MLTELARSPELRVEEYRCAGHGGGSDERNARHEVVFVRRGAFRVESARGDELVDSQRLLLFHRDEPYRVSHPAFCGDLCLIVGVDDAALQAILPAAAGSAATLDLDRPEAPFRPLTLPCPPALHAAAQRFAARLFAAGGDPLVAAEDGAELLRRAFAAAPPTPPRGTRRDRELVEAVRLELLRHLGERRSLAELAAAVGLSPFALARRFRAVTGDSLHQYRLELRLREAHARVADGAADLTALALDLGFADHAHFGNAFRRRFGEAPSRLRQRAARDRAPSRLSPAPPPPPSGRRPGAA